MTCSVRWAAMTTSCSATTCARRRPNLPDSRVTTRTFIQNSLVISKSPPRSCGAAVRDAGGSRATQLEELQTSAALLWRHRRIGDQAYRMIDLLTQSAYDYLSAWFEHDVIKERARLLRVHRHLRGPEVSRHRLRHHASPDGRASGRRWVGIHSRRHGCHHCIDRALGARFGLAVLTAFGCVRGDRRQRSGHRCPHG